MSVTNRARAAIWRVPVGLQLSALYTLLLIAILTLLGLALYARLDQFLVQNTADRVEQAATRVLHDPGIGSAGDWRDHRGPGPPNTGSTPSEVFALNVIRELSGQDVTVAVLDSGGAVITSTLAFNGSPRPVPT